MEDSTCKDLQVKRSDAAYANDDVLSQCDDLLIADPSSSSSSTLTADRSSGGLVNEIDFEQRTTVESTQADNSTTEEDIEEMPKLIKTPEPEKSRKNGKFNLRKSLAWDSAFFTSDGVLDADELSTMIEGGEKAVKYQLPGIEEEVYKSMDSISSFESDNLSLDCLEAELFVDIRASIQKSNKSSSVNNSSIKMSSGKKEPQPKISSALKKVDLDSGKRHAARTKDNNTSSIPQPKIINKLNFNSAFTKRASLSANHAKKDQDLAKKAHAAQKGTQTAKPTTIHGSKVTGVMGPRRAVPKPSIGSKSSSAGSSATLKTDPTRPSSSSSSCSSGNDVKVNFSRKKVDSKTAKLTAGSVIPKTPSSISPASSISDWSPESSRGSSKDTSVSFDGDTTALSNLPTPQISSQIGSQTGSLSRPPTGLRMPSPKIGFFDGGKTGVKTPTGSIRSQSNGPTSSNNVKFGKIPPPKAAVNMKPNPQKIVPKATQTSKPKSKSDIVTSVVSDHKTEASLNMSDKDSNKRPNSSDNNSEVIYNEPFAVVKDDNKAIPDGLRTPFAVKNSVSDTNGALTEKTVNFPILESQRNENSEVV